MKILLASNASWKPPKGGSTRSNRVWIDELRAAGHECRVAAPGALDMARLREHVTEFAPDWVLVSSEDLGQVLLREALEAAPGRVIYLAHTPQMFPFGPASLNANSSGAEMVQRCATRIAICEHTAAYIRHYARARTDIVHPPIYGPGPFQNTANHAGAIGFINPCAVKGMSLFREIARVFPQYRFIALPGWGTTHADREVLNSLPNVETISPVPDIGDFFARVRLLVVPSLWPEGFGLVVIEAMLRGVPVVSSDSGGLVDAKQGTDYMIPVNPILRYQAKFDEHLLPVPIIPPQDVRPWLLAIRELMEEQDTYEQASAAAFSAATRFVQSVEPGGLERVLLQTRPAETAASAERAVGDLLSSLSPERRALLAKLARRKQDEF